MLNKVISEADHTGKKLKTFVPANGATLAEQSLVTISGVTTERLSFIHQDASGSSVQQTTADGTLVQTSVRTGEYDALGRNVADASPFITLNTEPPPGEAGGSGVDMFGSSEGYRPGAQIYRIDGQVVPASQFMQAINSGAIGGLFGLLEMQARMSIRFAGYSLRFNNGDENFAGYDYNTAVSRMEGGETLVRNWFVNNSWAMNSSLFSFSQQSQTQQQQTKLPSDADLKKKVEGIANLCKDFLKKFLSVLDEEHGKAHRNENGDFDMGANFERVKSKIVDYTGKISKKRGSSPNVKASAYITDGKREIVYQPNPSDDGYPDLTWYGYGTFAELLHHAKEDGMYSDPVLDKAVKSIIGNQEYEAEKKRIKDVYGFYKSGMIAHSAINKRCQ